MNKERTARTRWLLRQMNFDPSAYDDYGKLGNGGRCTKFDMQSSGACFISDDEAPRETQNQNAKQKAQKKNTGNSKRIRKTRTKGACDINSE